MYCVMCGARVAADAKTCQVCGHAIPAEPDTQRTHAGLPAGRYVPSVYGPPVRPDIVPRASDMEAEAPPRRAFGYRPVDLPPPPQRDGSLRRPVVRLLLLALVLAVVATALAFAKGALPPHAAPATSDKAPAVGTQATSTDDTGQACPAAQIDAGAAQALAHVQLTSGLRNAGAHDYRPINAVKGFHAGQTGYMTFQVATAQAGTVGVLFCMSAERVPGSLSVPGGSSGRYGEFSAQFGARDVGQGHAILTWNGAVAADVPFTVSQ